LIQITKLIKKVFTNLEFLSVILGKHTLGFVFDSFLDILAFSSRAFLLGGDFNGGGGGGETISTSLSAPLGKFPRRFLNKNDIKYKRDFSA